MYLTDLLPEQNITLQVNVNGTILSFESKVVEVYPKKHSILATAVLKDGKPISFHGTGIMLHIILTFADAKPVIFKNVATKLMKKKSGEFFYLFSTLLEAAAFNRRENFRCYVGIYSSVQFGLNTAAHPAMIKDISYTGFAIVCDSDIELNNGQLIHTVLNDQPKPNGTVYNFQLYGLVARMQELDNGKRLYGCVINRPIIGLDKYIMEKERVRLQNSNGGKL